MDDLYKEGKFKKLGLSNYSSWLVSEVVNVCKVSVTNVTKIKLITQLLSGQQLGAAECVPGDVQPGHAPGGGGAAPVSPSS